MKRAMEAAPGADLEAMSMEQAADLARLEGLAAAEEPAPEAGQVEGAAGGDAAPAVDAAESLAGLLAVGGKVAAGLGYKRVGAVWAEPKCAALAAVVVPVLRKYPWGGQVLAFLEGGTGAEEMALVVVAAPMVLATVQAARADAADLAMADDAVATHGGAKPADVQGAVPVEWEPVEWENEN